MRDKVNFSLALLWIVAFAIFATILLSIPLFALDIHWEGLLRISGLSFSRLMENYGVLMLYLLNPFIKHLKMPDFPDSTSALIHFAEVKQLFILVMALSILLAYFYIKFFRNRLSFLYKNGLRLAMGLPVLLTMVSLLIGFDNFFIAFHKILFRDNTWLFDPVKDPIINVLTDNFFMYCFILFALLYEGLLLVLYFRKKLASRQFDRL